VKRLFDKLNTPTVALVVLIFFLAVNSFLLYRQVVMPTASAPSTPSTPRADTGAVPEVSSELGGTTLSIPSAPAGGPPAESEMHASGGLRESIRRCDGDRKECVQKFVAATDPEATYIGSRTDLNANGSGRNKEILYFEDPNLGTCEHMRQEYVPNDRLTYTVIILGQGSFESERGAECIPET
jgi:hypothetical protein